MYRPLDLTDAWKPMADIMVDNLHFACFLSLLQEDLNYMYGRDTVYYWIGEGQSIQVANECLWRAALEGMFSRGCVYLKFNIDAQVQGTHTPMHHRGPC